MISRDKSNHRVKCFSACIIAIGRSSPYISGHWFRMKNLYKQSLPAYCCLALAGLCLAAWFFSGGEKRTYEIRGVPTSRFIFLQAEDLPKPIEELGENNRFRAVRRGVEDSGLNLRIVSGAQIIKSSIQSPELFHTLAAPADMPPAGADNSSGGVMPLLPLDGANPPHLIAAQPVYYDSFDEKGIPLRWRISSNLIAGYSVRRGTLPFSGDDSSGLSLPEPDAPQLRAAGRPYQDIVEHFAGRYNLSVELVYAIIHSESDFSPTLVSSKSAMGLMQILPGTASGEVHRFLYGRSGDVSFAQLRVPETNIRYGTAYLHILLNRYFQDVRDPEAREYCAIAAYNMGPNRFLRLYGPTNSQAVESINSMKPDELYQDLLRRLPARETRYYVAKVKKMKNHYTALLHGSASQGEDDKRLE